MSIYCTYLTIYRGNKLPPFYIGYSSIKRIDEGYHGSVSSVKYKSLWREELKENPHLFLTKIISKHETVEEAKTKETQLQTYVQAHKNPLYTNMSIGCEKFYMDGPRSKEHIANVAKAITGRYVSPETRAKIGKANRGRLKGIKLSQERKQKMSENNPMNNDEIREKQRLNSQASRNIRKVCRISDRKEMTIQNFVKFLNSIQTSDTL